MEVMELEQQRLALEASLDKLRQSLKHWQAWDAEYEGLKEELASTGVASHGNDLTKLAKNFGGDLVNEKEILDLTGLSKNTPRDIEQITGLIERRQDYVQKNIDTIQRQFFDAEAKSEELAFAASSHGDGGEGGLPLTEIYEELDDEGNVISSSTLRPEESAAQMIESLKKAGLRDEDLDGKASAEPQVLKPAITNATPPMPATTLNSTPDLQTLSGAAVPSASGDSTNDEPERPSIRKKSVSFTADTKEPPKLQRPESEDGHKKVSFNEKVAVMPAAPPPDSRSVSFSPKVEEIPPQPLGPPSPNVQPNVQSTADDELQKSLRERFKPGERVATLNDDDELESIHVVLPENESEEDARTRRQMLEYHLNEVGNVVAQIDLDEAKASEGADYDDDDDDDNMSFHTSSEYLDDEDTPYTTGLSESEDEDDEYGRSVKPQITEEYRQQMKELQERLIGNLGPAPPSTDAADMDPEYEGQDVKRLVIRERNSVSSASSESSEKKAGAKKRVSFAEELDVAEPGSPPLKAQKHLQGENVGSVASTVAERPSAGASSTTQTPVVEKTSRFKKSRAVPSQAQQSVVDDMGDASTITDSPTGPPGITLASTLTERIPAQRPVAPPGEEDEDEDEVVQRRQLAAEYYRRRNEMIKQQGGFKRDEDEEPLMEERDGQIKKVSRFKAARLRPADHDGTGE